MELRSKPGKSCGELSLSQAKAAAMVCAKASQSSQSARRAPSNFRGELRVSFSASEPQLEGLDHIYSCSILLTMALQGVEQTILRDPALL